MTEYFEDHKVGASIKAHRSALGVLLSDLINEAGPGSETILRHVERATRPAVHLIEQHHTALMAAYVTGGHTPAVPLARREQWYANEHDTALWIEASRINPRVSWWWGVRSNAVPRGAWCYLCESLIHGYDVGRGMTKRARKAVMAHRLEHLTQPTAKAAPSKGTNTT